MLKVEFLGIPYSGKSFYQNDLLKTLKINGVNVQDYKQNFTSNINHVYKLNILEKLIFFLLNKKKKKNNRIKILNSQKKVSKINSFIYSIQNNIKIKIFKDFESENQNLESLIKDYKRNTGLNSHRLGNILGWYKDICVSHQILINLKDNNQIILDSEGFIHRLNSFILEEYNQNFIDLYLKYCPKPDILIFVDEKPEKCLQRMLEENNMDDVQKYQNNLDNFYINSKKIFNLVKDKTVKNFVINSDSYLSFKSEIINSIINK
jgi:thymidylate kinase